MNKNSFLVNSDYAKLMKKDDRIIVREPDRDPATMPPFANIGGINFVVSEYAPKSMRAQFRKPKSKKARIRKKWAKDARNWKDVNVVWLVDTSKITRIIPPSLSDLPYWQSNTELLGLDRALVPIPFQASKGV